MDPTASKCNDLVSLGSLLNGGIKSDLAHIFIRKKTISHSV